MFPRNCLFVYIFLIEKKEIILQINLRPAVRRCDFVSFKRMYSTLIGPASKQFANAFKRRSNKSSDKIVLLPRRFPFHWATLPLKCPLGKWLLPIQRKNGRSASFNDAPIGSMMDRYLRWSESRVTSYDATTMNARTHKQPSKQSQETEKKFWLSSTI